MIKIGLRPKLDWKKEHDVPARWFDKTEIRYLPEALGYPDFQHIPDELWHCLNCGEHCSKLDNPCLSKFKRFRRPYLRIRLGIW